MPCPMWTSRGQVGYFVPKFVDKWVGGGAADP
jgi:hypothetical protein